MTPEPLLEVSQVSKRFGGLQALTDVSMQVRRGEILGLIGPNGAGKSTLFDVISGTQFATAGITRFRGEDVSRKPAYQRRRSGLSRTFQKIRLFESLTVRENVLVAAMETEPDHVRRGSVVESTLRRFLLDNLSERPVSGLTLADKKRVEIARAVVGKCELLMLDESLSGLTHDEADEMVREVRALNAEEGITIIVVEHVMPVLMALATRIVVLNYGRVIAEGSPAEIAANPAVIEAYLGKRKVG